jgi:hypothetical protein
MDDILLHPPKAFQGLDPEPSSSRGFGVLLADAGAGWHEGSAFALDEGHSGFDAGGWLFQFLLSTSPLRSAAVRIALPDPLGQNEAVTPCHAVFPKAFACPADQGGD